MIFLLVGVLFSYLASNLSRKNKEAAKEITARKQSEAELSKYRDHLEELVKQRTTELEKANSDLKQDITERKQIEKDLADYRDKLEERVTERTAEIAKMNERLQILSHRLIEIQEEERGNIARELHDQIGQSLSIVKMLMDRASVTNDKEQQSLLGQARPQLAELIDQVSTLSLDLRPKILDDLGLVQALEWYFDRFTTQTNIRVQFKPSGNDKNLTSQVANTIYRVVQEALTNVALHAHATMVSVEFKAEASTIQLRIADDGIGFDPAALPVSNSGGIIGMQERINLVGGTLQVQSQPDAGTRLVADIPYQI